MIKLTNGQARRFLLLKHGLIGKHRFAGKRGVMDFFRMARCVQFDPVDVCGRNADIALNSRVKRYEKSMLDELLYKDRLLIDYFDKNLSIFPMEDIPALTRRKLGGGYAEAFDLRGGEAVERVIPLIRRLIKERGHISAKEIDMDEKIEWHWSMVSSLPRAALESMYFRGELIVHHKTGTNKSYAFMEDYVPETILNAGPPYRDEAERLAWLVGRRIGAVGMLWNKGSDAWLGISLKSRDRDAAFEKLLAEGKITGVSVDGIDDTLYCRAEDGPFVEAAALSPAPAPRCEFIAPLDSFIWDRKLIKALFGFEYSWEIYTPAVKRKYGGYVLPVLYGDRFIGRIEAACDRGAGLLDVRNIWYEESVRRTKKMNDALGGCLERFAAFNGVVYNGTLGTL